MATKAKAAKVPAKGKAKRKAKAAKSPARPAKVTKKASSATPKATSRAKAPSTRRALPAASPPVARAPPPSPPPPPPAAPPQPGWQPVREEPDWSPAIPAPSTSARAAAPRPAFDPATGAWMQALPPVPPQAAVAPDAPRTGTTRMLVWNIVLWIDLGFLGLNFLLALAAGAILLFAPDSGAADDLREQFQGGSSGQLVVETVLTFTMMGIIPLLWVLFTRQAMGEGTKRFLRLHSPFAGVMIGIVLTAVLLVGVAVLSVLYILATEGPDGLSLTESEGENPAVDAILDNLTWPTAVLIAFCAGVGEEILFRGVLLRKIGLWPQAILFGLAHAAGGYLPQVVFAFGLAVLFGYLLKRGVSMWALMTAHFLYDMTLLSIGLVYR